MASFSVVLVEPKYEGNVGSVARVMKNFGFSELVLVNPCELGLEAKKMSSHAYDVLKNAKIVENFDVLLDEYDFLVATSAIVATDKNSLRTPIMPEKLKTSLKIKGKVALLFGREDYGLFNEEIKECDLLVNIPTSKEYATLNIAVSVAVLLYEISKLEREVKGTMQKFEKANLMEKKVLLEKFDDLLNAVYENETQRKIVKKTFRTILGRAFVSGREAASLTGIFRKSLEKLRK